MKATGIVRTIDELGRIIIPKEIREKNDIEVGSKMEIFIDGKAIVLKPHVTANLFAGSADNLIEFKGSRGKSWENMNGLGKGL
ncbi:MAG: AbrB/MazE/SpoVT family DNA-binding domain-containing protein [Lachnospiraceae bacterium]|nr:AbrB/MazE/SpoVT family DNA-binding domain-containing protein [Lachnospiraceae bacterium]